MKRIVWMLGLCLISATLLAEPAKVAGVWNVALELETVKGHPVLTIKQDGEKLTGTYEGRYGPSALEGTVKEKDVEFTVTMVAEGMRTTGTFAGTVDGDTMSGTVDFEGAGEGTWSATRAKAPAARARRATLRRSSGSSRAKSRDESSSAAARASGPHEH
jgi:hypothetical protein